MSRMYKRDEIAEVGFGFKLIVPTLIMLMSSFLSGCSTYSSNFGCPDAKGLNCLPLSQVDKQIDSGEIERVGKRRKCRGGKCAVEGSEEMKPELREF